LLAARRQARQALESSKPETLPGIAQQLEPWFKDTPVVGVYRKFSALATEAAAVKPLWRSDWAATRESLLAAKGKIVLAAGAALMLMSEVDAGRSLLMAERALADGVLLRRREALLGREAAILFFSEHTDMGYIDPFQGEVRLENSALTGVGAAACGFAIAVPVGGPTWSAGMKLTLGKGSGQAVISCVNADVAELLLRIEADKLVVKIHSEAGWENYEEPRPNEEPRRKGSLVVRLVSRNNVLQVLVNNKVIAEAKKARIPAGSQLRIEIAELTWTLDDVQVIRE
jgi:hypothetical protein